MNFAKLLKMLRLEKELSQAQIAEVLGITQDSISLWENGKRFPDTQYVIKLADFFGVSTDYLLGRSDDFGNVNVQINAPALADDEAELIALYRSLLPEYKELALTNLRTWAGKKPTKIVGKNMA